MSGEKELIPIENYYNLASAIVEVACADYVDAKIIALYGYLSPKKYRSQLYKAVISYGGGDTSANPGTSSSGKTKHTTFVNAKIFRTC